MRYLSGVCTKVPILHAGLEVEGVERVLHLHVVSGDLPVLAEAVVNLVAAVQQPHLVVLHLQQPRLHLYGGH